MKNLVKDVSTTIAGHVSVLSKLQKLLVMDNNPASYEAIDEISATIEQISRCAEALDELVVAYSKEEDDE